MEIKTIKVTREDIQQGRPKSLQGCPVARAVRRAFRAQTVAVDPESIAVYHNKREMSAFVTPTSVVRFIRRFDIDLPTRPFSFKLEVQ